MYSIFSYWGHSVRVNWPERFDNLEKFLRCYFEPYFDVRNNEPSVDADFSVSLIIGGYPVDTPDFNTLSTITIDASKGFLNCTGKTTEQSGSRWVLMEPFGILVKIEPQDRTIFMWGRDEERFQIPVLRVIEDLILNEVQNSGAVVVHASATVTSNRATLVIGNKKAGKTTSLCRLLNGFESKKMANDNLCLRILNGDLVARGWPSFFKVSVATLVSNPQLYGDFPSFAKDTLDSDLDLWSVYEKVALFPAQVAMRFGTTICPEAPCSAFVFPEFNAAHPVRVSRIGMDEVAQELPEFLQGCKNPNHPEWLHLNPVNGEAVLDSLIRIIAFIKEKDFPLYRINWGPSLDDLLMTIPELRPFSKGVLACSSSSTCSDAFPPLPNAPQRK